MPFLPAMLLACGDPPSEPTDAVAGPTGETAAPHSARGPDTASTADTGHLPVDLVDRDGDGSLPPDDCDDDDPGVTPDGPERCNGRDDDCDGLSDEGFDQDGDGVGWCALDCNDWDPTVSPATPEVCNERDDDCDFDLDEGFDLDADGVTTCAGDCDDLDPTRNPWAVETCNGLDDDCNGTVDDALDGDQDGYRCQPGAEDCDDADAGIHPGAAERCNGVDDDCDAAIPPDEDDGDADGVRICGGDCDDGEPAIAGPFAEACDGLDNDCDPLTLETLDQDGDGSSACGGDCDDGALVVHPGGVERCNLRDDDCDGVADDGGVCGTCAPFETLDASYLGCSGARTWDAARADCRALDGDLASVPSAIEAFDLNAGIQATVGNASVWIGYNDQSVEGTFVWSDGSPVTFTDWNGGEPNNAGNEDCTENYPGGHWNDLPCSIGRGYVCELCALGLDDDGDGFNPCAGDCDEGDPARHPGAVERCDGVDHDCDGVIDDVVDVDRDGYTCAPGAEDCDDADPGVHPGAPERCNGVDDDCDLVIPLGERDGDADGVRVCGGDCDDAEPTIAAPFPELCDGLDNDCDPATLETDDRDGDGLSTCAGDCDDTTSLVGVAAPERCDGLDQDCDGVADQGGVCGACTPARTAAELYLACPDAASWTNSRASCVGFGGDLVSLSSSAEEDDLVAGVSAVLGARDVWIGFSDEALEGTFVWSDGAPPSFTRWRPGEPNNAGNEDCTTAYVGAARGWNDLPCTALVPSVCELCLSPDADGDGVDPCGGDCDEGDPDIHPGAGEICNGVDDDCDGVVDSFGVCRGCTPLEVGTRRILACPTPQDWPTARVDCGLFGGNLVSLSSAADEDAILTAAWGAIGAQPTWLGLNDLVAEGVYSWSDGRPVTYTSWAPGQPDNLGNEDCVSVDAARVWSDRQCLLPSAYVCEW